MNEMDNEEFQRLVEDTVLTEFGRTREEYDLALAKVMDGWDNSYDWLAGRDGFINVFCRIPGDTETFYALYINGYLMYDPKHNRLDLICKDNTCVDPEDGFSARVIRASISKPVDDSPKELLLTTHYVIGEPLNEVKG